MERRLKKSKSPADLDGGVLGCRGFHSSFRTTQRPTRTWIIYFDFAQTIQSLVRFLLGKHAQIVDRNHPSFRTPQNLILSNVQLSFSDGETWITIGTTDLVTLRPFIAAPSLRAISSDHMTSNAHSKKLENSHWNISALIACCFP